MKLRTARGGIFFFFFHSISATGSNQNDIYLKNYLRDSCWRGSCNQRKRDLRLCGSPQTDWILQMCPRFWGWIYHSMTPVTEGSFFTCSAAHPEPFGTCNCLLPTLNQDLCNLFPLFQTRVCLPELLARQSEMPFDRCIYWYKTCYPLTVGHALHIIWFLPKPSRWSLLMISGCAVLPCTEVSKGRHLQAAHCSSLCFERSLGF